MFSKTSLTPNTTYYYNVTSWVNPTQTLGTFNFTTFVQQCNPNWVQYNDACLINDSYQTYYVDSNACGNTVGLPSDNGSFYPCNFCSEDLQQSLSVCLWNGTGYFQDVTWIDNNYYSCCVLTGQILDCSINAFPYNISTVQMCTALSDDFDVQLDDTVYFGFDVGGYDKVYGKVYINGSEEYSCVSYVKTTTGKLLQSNPVYELQTTSLINVLGKPSENREVFVTNNGLANVFWTKENLVVDGSEYVFGVECSSNSTHKISEKVVNVFYENVNSPVTRWFWFRDNMLFIGLGLIITIFIIILASMVIKGAWR